MIKIKFFEFANSDAISLIIKEQLKCGNIEQERELFDCILEATLNDDKLSTVIDCIEDEFLLKNSSDFCKYLLLFNDKANCENMARYYLDLCVDEIKNDPKFDKILNKYAFIEKEKIKGKYFENNFEKTYTYRDVVKTYNIYSFSNEIGKNMTLLKTPYGSIIFDCGAKCQGNEAATILEEELKDFLKATKTEIDDIKAVIVSHAHLDHYGSLATIINVGIDPRVIFMSDETKQLILSSSKNINLSNGIKSINSINWFRAPYNHIVIKSFANGHILGSECYLVSFDEINVLYSGDYCLHNQLTVKGLNSQSILDYEKVKENGIDCFISESTYGNSQHYLNYDCATHVLKHLVKKLLSLDIKVFLPSFAIGRSQELALMLNQEYSVLIDGLAVKISREYEDLARLKIFNGNARYCECNDDISKSHNFDCNNIIIASSGMLVKDSTSYEYIKDFLNSDSRIAVIKTGFISSESYGNALLDEWKSKNNILLSVSLSAHADYEEIIALIKALQPRNIVAIHGNGIGHICENSASEEKLESF